MPVVISRVTAVDVAPLQVQILQVYEAAFSPPPYRRDRFAVQTFARSLERHLRYRDFRLCTAREAGSDRLLGFTYGYTGATGQWWYDLVATVMRPADVERWLSGGFEFVELAVLPGAQGRGIGGTLHDALLAGLPHRTAALSTLQQETDALHLYRKRGWTVLIDRFVFPAAPQPYQIMGLDLAHLSSVAPIRE